MSSSATAFAPASVGNIGVGFDLLGHAIDGPRDLATVRRIDAPEVRIDAIRGRVAGVDALPLDAAANTAGRALIARRDTLRDQIAADRRHAVSPDARATAALVMARRSGLAGEPSEPDL